MPRHIAQMYRNASLRYMIDTRSVAMAGTIDEQSFAMRNNSTPINIFLINDKASIVDDYIYSYQIQFYMKKRLSAILFQPRLLQFAIHVIVI